MTILNVCLMFLQQSDERIFLPTWEKIRRKVRKRNEFLYKLYSLCKFEIVTVMIMVFEK